MTRKLASAMMLMVKGAMFVTVALVDWLTAKANVSERGYLMPFRVASEFHAAVVAAWHGQNRLPSRIRP